MMTFWKKLSRTFGSFRSDRAGNVILTFALASLPIVGTVGFAVDYSHANSVKAAMQAAIDSTALMLSKEASTDSSTTLQSNAQKYFTALFTRPEATNATVTATYTTTGGSALVVTGSANVPTVFLGVLGYRNIPVNASSTAKWGSSRLRVALVLDNTGSMSSSGKMTALKSATQSLLTQLQNAASTNGDVYVSIIPFTTVVNVDPGNNNSAWIDWSDYGNCTGGNNQLTAGDWTKYQCLADHGTWTTYSSSMKKSWKGCVTDRGDLTGPNSAAYDTNVTAPGSASATKYPAVDYTVGTTEYCGGLQQAIGLTYNWSSLSALVNSMQPAGATNQNIGLQMGWMSLVGGGIGGGAFTVPAEDSNYTYQHVIILLTDGLNTQNRWYGDGGTLGSSDDAKIDARQALTCSNFKAASTSNILYTIQVNTDGDPTSTLLQNCASSSDKFFLLTSASAIVTTFNAIGTNLTKLRVAR
jgi:Flp pilus assembly protein TadG